MCSLFCGSTSSIEIWVGTEEVKGGIPFKCSVRSSLYFTAKWGALQCVAMPHNITLRNTALMKVKLILAGNVIDLFTCWRCSQIWTDHYAIAAVVIWWLHMGEGKCLYCSYCAECLLQKKKVCWTRTQKQYIQWYNKSPLRVMVLTII